MTEPTPAEPTETAEGAIPHDTSTGSAGGKELTTSSDPEPSPNSEAARWRTKLRETEAQRDALAERITGYQRRECEAAVADLLEEPGDLWEIGQADVSAFYGEDGELDEAQLRAATGALCEMRPRLAKPQGPRHENFGQFSPPAPMRGSGWSDVLQG
jgi:hypothetical protein